MNAWERDWQERNDADLITNWRFCPNKCGMTVTDIEQNPCLECSCDWFHEEKYQGLYDEEEEQQP
jgi:hypothetical protein